MAAVARITQSEILDALAVALESQAPEDAQTAQELVDNTGMHKTAVLRALGALQREGRLVLHKVKRTRIDGVTSLVPAYTIKPAKRK